MRQAYDYRQDQEVQERVDFPTNNNFWLFFISGQCWRDGRASKSKKIEKKSNTRMEQNLKLIINNGNTFFVISLSYNLRLSIYLSLQCFRIKRIKRIDIFNRILFEKRGRREAGTQTKWNKKKSIF